MSARNQLVDSQLSDSWGELERGNESDHGILTTSEDEGTNTKTPRKQDEVGVGARSFPPHSDSFLKQQDRGSETKVLDKSTLSPSTPSPRKPETVRSQPSFAEPQFVMPSPSTEPYGADSWIDMDRDLSPRKPVRRPVTQRSRPRQVHQDQPLKHSRPPKAGVRENPRELRSRAGGIITGLGTMLATSWNKIIAPLLGYSAGVVGTTAYILQPLFGFLLVFVLAWLAVRFAWNGFQGLPFGGLSLGSLSSVGSVLTVATSPCQLPLISMLPFCREHKPDAGRAEFRQLVQVQSSFEEILQSAAQGVHLPLDMKRSEASIRDLKYIVSYSHLPSRSELVMEFDDFIATARAASSDLTKFNSRIGRAVDHIISINKNTLRVLDGYANFEANRGSLDRLLSSAPGPFKQLASGPSQELTQKRLFEEYLKHTSRVEDQILQLIVSAQTLLGILQNLDDRLDVIHAVCARDGIAIQASRDETLAQLWTILGGNRKAVEKMDNSLKLLGSVSEYRRLAWAHVSATMLKLESIAAELEELRERVARPGLSDPLYEGSETYNEEVEVSLMQHIETIQLGVRRLEEQRGVAKGIEKDAYRRVLDGDGGNWRRDKDRAIEGREV